MTVYVVARQVGLELYQLAGWSHAMGWGACAGQKHAYRHQAHEDQNECSAVHSAFALTSNGEVTMLRPYNVVAAARSNLMTDD